MSPIALPLSIAHCSHSSRQVIQVSPALGKSCPSFPIHTGWSHAQEVCYIFFLVSRWDNKAQLEKGDAGIRKGKTGASRRIVAEARGIQEN